MSERQIVAEELAFDYPDGTTALRGVTFAIRRGEAVGIVGANGAGKSTLLLHLVGCLFPSRGTLVIGGEPVQAQTVVSIRQRVGLVFQNPDDQLFTPSVREDVAFGPRNQGLSEPEVAQRVRDALAVVGAEQLIDRPPYHLSGGEKRAVSIATVLAMSPDVLVLDEPSAGLDPHARRGMIRLLSGLDHTRIVASHDLDLILEVCQRVILMSAGRIAADGPSGEILRSADLLAACNLELPLGLQRCPACARIGAMQIESD